jgi:hypothetical protein
MRIEADLFSGRPNPAWEPSAAEAEALAALLACLESAAAPAEPFDGLGYRGMVVTGIAPGVHPCGELRVANGFATGEGPEGARAFSDPGRALEAALVAMAGAHLPADLHGLLRTLSGLPEAD